MLLTMIAAGLDEYMGGIYQDTRKYDLLNFWSSISTDRAASDLMLEHTSRNSAARRRKRARNSNSRSDSVEFVGGGSFPAAADRLAEVWRRAEEDLREGGADDDHDDGLFAAGSGIGTGELAGQRVLQVSVFQFKFPSISNQTNQRNCTFKEEMLELRNFIVGHLQPAIHKQDMHAEYTVSV